MTKKAIQILEKFTSDSVRITLDEIHEANLAIVQWGHEYDYFDDLESDTGVSLDLLKNFFLYKVRNFKSLNNGSFFLPESDNRIWHDKAIFDIDVLLELESNERAAVFKKLVLDFVGMDSSLSPFSSKHKRLSLAQGVNEILMGVATEQVAILLARIETYLHFDRTGSLDRAFLLNDCPVPVLTSLLNTLEKMHNNSSYKYTGSDIELYVRAKNNSLSSDEALLCGDRLKKDIFKKIDKSFYALVCLDSEALELICSESLLPYTSFYNTVTYLQKSVKNKIIQNGVKLNRVKRGAIVGEDGQVERVYHVTHFSKGEDGETAILDSISSDQKVFQNQEDMSHFDRLNLKSYVTEYKESFFKYLFDNVVDENIYINLSNKVKAFSDLSLGANMKSSGRISLIAFLLMAHSKIELDEESVEFEGETFGSVKKLHKAIRKHSSGESSISHKRRTLDRINVGIFMEKPHLVDIYGDKPVNPILSRAHSIIKSDKYNKNQLYNHLSQLFYIMNEATLKAFLRRAGVGIDDENLAIRSLREDRKVNPVTFLVTMYEILEDVPSWQDNFTSNGGTNLIDAVKNSESESVEAVKFGNATEPRLISEVKKVNKSVFNVRVLSRGNEGDAEVLFDKNKKFDSFESALAFSSNLKLKYAA